MKLFKRFYQYVWQHPFAFIAYLVVSVVAVLLGESTSFFLKWITEALTSQQFSHGVQLCFMFFGTLVASTLLKSWGAQQSDSILVKCSSSLQLAVIKHIHALDFAYHTNKSSGKLISIMRRGDDSFFNFFEVLNGELLQLSVSFGFMLVSFLHIHPKFMVWGVAALALSLLLSGPLLRLNFKKRKIFISKDDDVSAARVDNLTNFDTVKYFAQEKTEQQRFIKLLAIWSKALLDFSISFRVFDIVIGNISNIAMAGVLITALLDVQSGALSLAQFVFIASFSLSFFPRLIHVLFSIRVLAKYSPDLSAYFAILDEEMTVPDPIQPLHLKHVEGKISFENVSFKYPRSPQILKNFSLDIAAGESVAFVGYSGAGKTTIAKLLMRMYDPTKGQITIDGIPLHQFTKSELRSWIGIVPQDPMMFNQSIRQNILYARPKADPAEVQQVLQQANIADFIHRLPDGLDTVVGERGMKLSGGQRQRLAIARVLLEKAPIIIFDEATSALDSESERDIQTAFWNLAKDSAQPRTSIIIAHRLSTIMRADRIVVLNHGKVVESGTHQQLIQKEGGQYKHLWSLQQNGFLIEESEPHPSSDKQPTLFSILN